MKLSVHKTLHKLGSGITGMSSLSQNIVKSIVLHYTLVMMDRQGSFSFPGSGDIKIWCFDQFLGLLDQHAVLTHVAGIVCCITAYGRLLWKLLPYVCTCKRYTVDPQKLAIH